MDKNQFIINDCLSLFNGNKRNFPKYVFILSDFQAGEGKFLRQPPDILPVLSRHLGPSAPPDREGGAAPRLDALQQRLRLVQQDAAFHKLAQGGMIGPADCRARRELRRRKRGRICAQSFTASSTVCSR